MAVQTKRVPRAERDLVIASSACPDDLSPTNGFNPTGIMVRVFPRVT